LQLAPKHNRKHMAACILVLSAGVFYLSIKVIIPIGQTLLYGAPLPPLRGQIAR
jgi:hypothetical protein